jgi:hypothetical protein
MERRDARGGESRGLIMNLAAYPSPTRDAPPATGELVIETRIHHELEAAFQFQIARRAFVAAVQAISSDLAWIKGYDKETILDLMADIAPPGNAEVERWVEDRFVGDE